MRGGAGEGEGTWGISYDARQSHRWRRPPAAGRQYLYVSDAWPGRIYKLDLGGKVLGWLGGAGKQLGQFGLIHEMACPSENELYVGELLNWRLQKLTLHP